MGSSEQSSPAPDRSANGGREERGEHRAGVESTERYGPVTLARHIKRDGRALILYETTDGAGREGLD